MYCSTCGNPPSFSWPSFSTNGHFPRFWYSIVMTSPCKPFERGLEFSSMPYWVTSIWISYFSQYPWVGTCQIISNGACCASSASVPANSNNNISIGNMFKSDILQTFSSIQQTVTVVCVRSVGSQSQCTYIYIVYVVDWSSCRAAYTAWERTANTLNFRYIAVTYLDRTRENY